MQKPTFIWVATKVQILREACAQWLPAGIEPHIIQDLVALIPSSISRELEKFVGRGFDEAEGKICRGF